MGEMGRYWSEDTNFIIKLASSGDLMYIMVTIVSNTVSHPRKLLNLTVFTTRNGNYVMGWMF